MMALNMVSMDKLDIKLDNSDYYIHFNSKDECNKFVEEHKNTSEFGHFCCYGKGILIKSHENTKITSYQEITEIKNSYLKRHL